MTQIKNDSLMYIKIPGAMPSYPIPPGGVTVASDSQIEQLRKAHDNGVCAELSIVDDVPVAKPKSVAKAESVPPDGEPVSELVCTVCGRECKSAFGLQAHMKSHEKE